MLAVDTNVLVRIIVADDARQSPRARALVAANQVFVSRTVLLETEWVLRGSYGLAAPDVLNCLSSFVRLPQVTLESPEQIVKALGWLGQGMDFADALHLASTPNAAGFVTFDKRLVQNARRLKIAGVAAP